jgi:ribosome-binding factor A
MPKEFSRGQRVAEQIRRELAELIRLELKDPRVGFITLTDVEITPDYAHAKVYFTSMTGQEGLDEIQRGLRRASSFLRRELGKRIRIHTLPELHFHYDPSVENGNRISALIDKAIEADRHNAEEGGEGGEGDTDPPIVDPGARRRLSGISFVPLPSAARRAASSTACCFSTSRSASAPTMRCRRPAGC